MFLITFKDENEKQSFENLYYKYRNLVYHQSLIILGDSSDAQEVVYMTFEATAQRYELLKDMDSRSLKNYLVTVCRNKSIDILKQRKKEIPHDYVETQYEDSSQYGKNPEIIISDKECYERMKTLISELKPVYKDVFMLKTVYKMSYEKIAEILKISENTVKKRFQRARTKIAEQLIKEGYGRE